MGRCPAAVRNERDIRFIVTTIVFIACSYIRTAFTFVRDDPVLCQIALALTLCCNTNLVNEYGNGL
jgi:hypothetical protein